MKGVILDAGSLGKGEVDLSPITDLLDEWQVYGTSSPTETIERIGEATVVLSNKIVLDEEKFSIAGKLRLISVMATGTNNIDLDAAKRADITVSNAVAYATPSVVQHTISLMLALSTNLPAYIHDVKSGAWQKAPAFCMLDHPISELDGKVLGIVGFGELGSSVAAVARALGMKVLISQRPGCTNESKYRLPFDDLISEVDYLSLHCPLTAETENLVNLATLKKMKSSAFLINTARGGLVDAADLLQALGSNIIAGAAVDVLNTEPPPENDLLTNANQNNLIVTPHNAWGAIESRQRLVQQMADNINGFLTGKPIRVVTK
ncbi:MAG: D-2-hydroxyacid dehydrogenase [Gammaproteobacteria bacterium]|nr:D-2-hydroxyacid dehydrogenase [Gammaproteobacteria bacterium]